MLDSICFYFGTEGYNIYKEMHHNNINRVIHGIFMPLLVYGLFLGLIPQLTSSKANARKIVNIITSLYILHYLTFDPLGALLVIANYSPVLICVFYTWGSINMKFDRMEYMPYFITGFSCVMFSLIIQEGIGHTIFEQKNSNLFVLPTSILMAPLFGVRGLLGIV